MCIFLIYNNFQLNILYTLIQNEHFEFDATNVVILERKAK